jgi:hypothetical protein
MKNIYFITLCFLLCIASCIKKDVADCNQADISVLNTDLSKANVRIKNETGIALCQVELTMDTKVAHYGALVHMQTSGYMAYDKIYKFAFVKAYIPNDSLQFQPIDYVGETPLVAGLYSYILKRGSGKNLLIELRKD